MSSSLPTIGIILLVLGLILAAIGGIILIIHSNKNEQRSRWMWALLIGGAILALIGLLMWIFFRESGVYHQKMIQNPLQPQPQVQVVAQPQAPVTTQYVRTQQTYPSAQPPAPTVAVRRNY